MNIGLMTPFWPTTRPDLGIGNNYQRLAGVLAARGHRVTVFYLNRHKPFWQRGTDCNENGFRVIEVPCRVSPGSSWRGRFLAAHLAVLAFFLFKSGKILRGIEVMEATSNGGFPWFFIRFISRGRIPLLVRISTTGTQMKEVRLQGSRYHNWMETALIRSARHLCTHTQAHREAICSLLGVDPARMAVIPHGIVLPELPLPVAAPERFILTVGRFEPRKGTDTLLQAVPLVLAQQPDCRFVLAGAGDQWELWTKKFLEAHGHLADRVRFLGHVPLEELETLYQTCAFFVSPATYESFGMTYLEAMRYGKPVIGCRQSGGAEEVIGDGGLLARPGDAAHLAEMIVRLWIDQGLHQKLSARARLRAEYYSLDLKAERSEQHYAKMIAGEI